MELFYGLETTNKIFNTIYKSINKLGNLITLENSVHYTFENRSMALGLLTISYHLI